MRAVMTTTGISGLDAQLGGGVPRGSTILLLAEPGNAISLFSEQFGGGGLIADEPTIYASFDRHPDGITANIRAFRPGNGRVPELTVFDGYSTQFAMARHAANSPASGVTAIKRDEAFNVILKSIMSAGESYRLVIESLSGFTKPDNEERVIDFVRNLAFIGQEYGGVQLLSVVKGLHSPRFESQLRHIATGVLEVGAERKGFGVYSYLLVSKMLNVRDPLRLLLFKETDKGVWLESTKRVF